jgi:UPF0716 protein FxsA
MLFKLFLAFTIIPFLEIALLIKLGGQIGVLNTLMIVIITALVGAQLARRQGVSTMLKVREAMNRGEVPAEEMMDAMIIFIAGILLLTPGFITDAAGILLLIPATRNAFKRWLRVKFDSWVAQNSANIRIYRG